MRNKIIITSLITCNIFFSACKKLVDVDGPTTGVSSENIYNNNATAIGAVTSLFVDLSSGATSAPEQLSSLSCIGGLSADELSYFNLAANALLSAYFQNNLTAMNAGNSGAYWNVTYQNIYVTNAALEGLANSTSLTPTVKQQLLGEAKFMRAFYYFYLVNLYGDVPLVLSTDYSINSLIKKASKTLVYEQIKNDLIEAKSFLSNNYLKGDLINIYPSAAEERIRPTKWAAIALLARVCLFTKDWNNAELNATAIIDNKSEFGLLPKDRINEVFSKQSREAIWQIQPVKRGANTNDASLFILPASGPSISYPVYLSESFISSIELNDLRKEYWIGNVLASGKKYYFPYKYKLISSSDPDAPINEYNTIMRLAEQYLIRAEARAEHGDLYGAISDVDQIRERAGLDLIKNANPNIGKEDLLNVILKERRIELFTEWGSRWLDLKRTNNVDEVMTIETPKKANGGVWRSYQKYYPISSLELKFNPNLIQTEGY